MKPNRLLLRGALLLALSIVNFYASTSLAQPTAFSFQGRLLNPDGTPANGNYDFQFWVFDGSSGGASIAGPIPINGVGVANGVFSTTIDPMGGVFTGADRYVQMLVAPAGTGNFLPVPDRVKVLSAPYSVFAGTAASVKSGAAVTSLNGLKDDVVIQGSSCISVTKAGNTLMLDCAGGGGGNYWLQSGSGIYYNGGNVGIGINLPAANLHLYNPTDSATHLIETGGGTDAWSKVQFKNLNGQWDIGTSRAFVGDVFYIDRIGTPDLEFTLAPNGNAGLSGAPLNDTKLTIHTSPNTGFSSQFGLEHSDGTHRLSTVLDSFGAWLGTRSADPLNFFVNGYNVSSLPSMTIDTSGRVGIGTPSPVVNLDVRGSDMTESTIWSTAERAILSLHSHVTGQDQVWTLESGLKGDPRLFGIYDRTRDQIRLAIDTLTGNVGIGASHAAARLEVVGPSGTHTLLGASQLGASFAALLEGDLRVEGDSTVTGHSTVGVLTITGGSDLAEPFNISAERVEKGAVVVIDQDNPGQLRLSERAYDTRVAGVVSGAHGINPGITLRQDGALSGSENVALSGRVYVQADARYGAIKPGDLLTTSDTPGHAMRATDHAKSQGAILGKAMSGLNRGQGMVLVLVTLQ